MNTLSYYKIETSDSSVSSDSNEIIEELTASVNPIAESTVLGVDVYVEALRIVLDYES